MGIRGAIGRTVIRKGENDQNVPGWSGRYHHWDSYPSGLGKTLYDLFNGHFKHDLEAMLKYLIDDHPAGWSTINKADFTQEPGCNENGFHTEGPQCFCHGGRGQKGWEVTEEDAAGSGVEYAYVFDQIGALGLGQYMHILSSYHADGGKMIGAFGMGDPDAHWQQIAVVDLQGPEPAWDEIGP